MIPLLSSSSGWGWADTAPLPLPYYLVVAHRFSGAEELSWSIMCVLISWREMGQISSTSKGEISCLIASSFTSEAKTFSAKERIASSISERRKQDAGSHGHLAPSRPNRRVLLAISLELGSHLPNTPPPPPHLEDPEHPPDFSTSLQGLSHTLWTGNTPRHPQHTRKAKHNPQSESSTNRLRKKQTLGKAT